MTSAGTAVGRFVRRTSLGEDEYRVNFKQIDCDVLDALTSDEACAVTPLMSKIYIRLIRAPLPCWEREGVLRFVGEEREGDILTAWEKLVELTGVANSTLSKALNWMHDSGIIGYDARKNGVGIRIFINRARSSIRHRGEQKNLRLVPTPSSKPPAPSDGIPFKEGVSGEDLDKGINPRAHPRAAQTPIVDGAASLAVGEQQPSRPNTPTAIIGQAAQLDLGQVVSAVKRELEPVIASMCGDAISHACRKEAELNREWFEKAAIPKAVRVAQRESFDLLRAYGVVAKKPSKGVDVGRNSTASDDAKATESVRTSVTAFLGEAAEAIRQVAANDQVSCNPVLLGACRAAAGELDCLRDRAVAGEVGLLTDPEDLESRLNAVDDGIMEALWRSTGSDEIKAMSEAARIELRRYEGTMAPEAYRDTLRRHVDKRLRERHCIPRLSLFYM
jgi:hypothetical protein